MKFDCEFLFAALAEKHNAVIRKIREIPPLEWGGEFLELEPQVLRFLGTSVKLYPECPAFRTAHTLASAPAVSITPTTELFRIAIFICGDIIPKTPPIPYPRKRGTRADEPPDQASHNRRDKIKQSPCAE